MTSRVHVGTLLALAATVGGCVFFSSDFPCEGNENCPTGSYCGAEGRCVVGELPADGGILGDGDGDVAGDGDGDVVVGDGDAGDGDGDVGPVLVENPGYAGCDTAEVLTGTLTITSPVHIADNAPTVGDCVRLDGDLVVRQTNLENLDGLEYLREVRGSVTIRQNDNLASIAGVMAIEAVTGLVTIRQNGALCNDDAVAFVDQVAPGGGSQLQQNNGVCP